VIFYVFLENDDMDLGLNFFKDLGENIWSLQLAVKNIT